MSRDAVLLVILVLALVAVGAVMLYSATAVTAEKSAKFQDGSYFLKRQLLWAFLGVGAMIVAARVPYRMWDRWRLTILLGSIILLCLVFVPGVGAEINRARRWIRAGSWFLQPSEAAKVGIAVFLAGFAAADPERLRRFFRGFVPACLTLAAVCGLILVEPDIGTAFFVALVMGLMLFLAGVRMAHVLPIALAGALLVGYYALTHTEHFQARWESYWHPERDPLGKGHQPLQSKMALGAGHWTGVGLGSGTSKLYYLPEVHSDFIFAVIGEELGFVGAVAVLLLYLAFGAVGYRIMRRAPDRFGALLSFALTTYIILQAAMNVAVVTVCVPTKGIPLPFVSAGGSSLLFAMAGVGMLVSVSNASERGECREGESGSCSPAAAPAATSFPASPSPNLP